MKTIITIILMMFNNNVDSLTSATPTVDECTLMMYGQEITLEDTKGCDLDAITLYDNNIKNHGNN